MKPARTLYRSKYAYRLELEEIKAWSYNTHGQFFFGPKLSDMTAYFESHVETIIRLKYTTLINKYVK